MELTRIFEELQTCTEDIVIFRKLISLASSHKIEWNEEYFEHLQPLLGYILQIIIPGPKIGRERALLASHTFFTLLSKEPSLKLLKNTLINFLTSKSNEVHIFNETYDIIDPDLFKVTCIYGYLQVNDNAIYSNEICLLILDLIFEHCIKYTKHSYFAYKILHLWLQRIINTNIWSTHSELERKLEAIIFSNWCNAINEISKQNSTLIFNMYLKIMEREYNGYLEYLFDHCNYTISWQNELKYDILAEILKVWGQVKKPLPHDFLFSLCTSLTRYNLRAAGTKAYFAISNALSENEWKEHFGNIINYLFHYWESTASENHDALQFLCKHWLEPIIEKYRNILPYLWDMIADIKQHFLRSHLQKIACEMRIKLPQQTESECYINDGADVVRLNGFAINCYAIIDDPYNINEDHFSEIKSFLWHNANSTTVYMRDGIEKYFKVFFTNILKMCESKRNIIQKVYKFMDWIYEFLLDCFELGSCYQRKILGLKLHRSILSFTKERSVWKINNARNISYPSLVKKHLKSTGNWKFTNREILFILLKLTLDSALDVKQLTTSIILDYFDKDTLSLLEVQVVFNTAVKNCNSSKFYEIESGTALLSILANWFPINELLHANHSIHGDKEENKKSNTTNYSDFLFNEAKQQLMGIKEDILKAVVQNEPFYGVLTALLHVTLRNGPEKCYATPKFYEDILCLLEDAVEFFLSILSLKSENKEYSSSFAEMGLAIDETIKNSEINNTSFDDLSLTPAHQVLISCIWMSLKVICELACEIGISMISDEMVERSVNIIVTILLKCRHKGVMEAAGSVIGQLTRYLCKEAKYIDLLKIHITRILENDSMNSLNITRRGAGLSIMFHRIIVGDNGRDRYLLHFAIEKLMDMLDNKENCCLDYVKSEHDSPWARRLHFLRTLVADKEIHAHLTPYMERISLTCFRYLESDVWTVRNASLQLFGSIVPRLMGQNSGGLLNFGNGYSINHFVTHYPILAGYILKELSKFSLEFPKFSTALYLHSSIVPLLIILSKCSTSACNLVDYSSNNYVKTAKYSLRLLFENPVLYVRILAAKAYAALTNFLEIHLEIERLKQDITLSKNSNLTHGYLLTIKYLKEKLDVESTSINFYSELKEDGNKLIECPQFSRYDKIMEIWHGKSKNQNVQICYILETLFLQLQQSIPENISDNDIIIFKQNMSLLSSEKIKPGFFLFIEELTKLHANYISRTSSINNKILQAILDSNYPNIDQTVSFLNHLEHNISIMMTLIERLLFHRQIPPNNLLLNAMINYILETLKQKSLLDIKTRSDIKNMIENIVLEDFEAVKYCNLWSLKCTLIILFSENEEIIDKVLSYALQLCVHKEEHMRFMATRFIQFLVHRFTGLSNRNKQFILHCCLILLKDEISEIRKFVSECIKLYVCKISDIKWNNAGHDEYLYQKLLSNMLLKKLDFPVIEEMNVFFVKLFTNSIRDFNINSEIENPFYHEDSSFYREETKFLNFCFYYTIENKDCDDKRIERNNFLENYNVTNNINIVNNIKSIRYQFQKRYLFDYNNLDDILSIKYADYLLMKQKIVMQEYGK